MPRIKQFKEEEVLEKAIAIFWEKGYHATSMQDLVDAMGISRASLYDTFGSKEELFERAFKSYRETTTKKVRSFLYSHGSVREGLGSLLEKAINDSLADTNHKGCFVVNTTTELAPKDPSICDSLCNNKVDMEQLFTDYIRTGIDQGEIPSDKDPQKIGSFFFALYSGLMVVAKVETDRQRLMRIVETGLEVLG